jgi:hypothetical protein
MPLIEKMEARHVYTVVFGGGEVGVYHENVYTCADHDSILRQPGVTIMNYKKRKPSTQIVPEDQADPDGHLCDFCRARMLVVKIPVRQVPVRTLPSIAIQRKGK